MKLLLLDLFDTNSNSEYKFDILDKSMMKLRYFLNQDIETKIQNLMGKCILLCLIFF